MFIDTADGYGLLPEKSLINTLLECGKSQIIASQEIL
jgi:hypothetical protein